MNEQEILHAITPDVERLLERHLETTKEWFPHEYVPYSRGRDHMEGHVWSPEDADLAGAQLSPEVRSALLVNLLTEDNLPSATETVTGSAGENPTAPSRTLEVSFGFISSVIGLESIGTDGSETSDAELHPDRTATEATTPTAASTNPRYTLMNHTTSHFEPDPDDCASGKSDTPLDSPFDE